MTLELYGLKLKIKVKDFLVRRVYRNPSSNFDSLASHFQDFLSKISSNKLLFILGDFNIDLLDYASHTPSSDFINNFFHTDSFPAFIIQLQFQNILRQLLTTCIQMLLLLI